MPASPMEEALEGGINGFDVFLEHHVASLNKPSVEVDAGMKGGEAMVGHHDQHVSTTH